MAENSIQAEIAAMSPDHFKRVCKKIMAGLGFVQFNAASVQDMPVAFLETIERKSTDGMFCTEESWLIVFTRSRAQSIAKGLEATVLGAQVFSAQNIMVVVFGKIEREIIEKYHNQARSAGIRSAFLHDQLACILLQDYAPEEITATAETPFSFAALRGRMRLQAQEAAWRKEFLTLTTLPIHVNKVQRKAGENPTGKIAKTTDILRETDLFGAIYKSQSFLLLGDPGAGKTTCLQKLAEELASAGGRTPVFLSLNRFEGNLLNALGEALCNQADVLSEQEVEDLLTSGAITVILDGLNEIQSQTLQPQLVAQVNNRTDPEAPTSRSHWIISSRRYDYTHAPQLKYLDQQTWSLLPLSSDMVYDFLASQLGQEAGQVAYFALGTSMREICSNPLLLSMLLHVLQVYGRLPTNRGTLYHQFVDLLLHRGEKLPNNQKELAALGNYLGIHLTFEMYCRLAHTVLTNLAKEMQEMGTTAIGGSKLLDVFMQSSFQHLSMLHQRAATILYESLLTRGLLKFINGKIVFFHHTFQEYFHAAELKNTPLDVLIPSGREINGAVREALVFMASTLETAEDVERLIERVLTYGRDALLAYEIMQSTSVEPGKNVQNKIAQAFWQQMTFSSVYVGERKRQAQILIAIAENLDLTIEQLLRDLLNPVDEKTFSAQLLKFYQELGDLEAQRQLVNTIDPQEDIPSDLLLRMAIAASEYGNRQDSIRLYTEYLEKYSEPSIAYVAYGNRAIVYEAIGDLEKAEEDYKKSIALKPHGSLNRTNYARLLIQKDQKDLALNELKIAVESKQKYHDAYYQLGKLLLDKEPQMALYYLEEAVQLVSNPVSQTLYLTTLLELQEKLGYYARAMSSIQRLIDLNPTSHRKNEWKQRYARLNLAYIEQAKEYEVLNGEADLTVMARMVLENAGWQIDHMGLQWIRAISNKQRRFSPLLVLLLDLPRFTESVVRQRITALQDDEKEIKSLLLLTTADMIDRDARIYIAQQNYPIALITSVEIREALMSGTQNCEQLLLNVLDRASERANPFFYRKLIQERSEFFGREIQKEQFISLLLRRELVGLYGIHKIGKSSFLRQIRQHLAIQAQYITPVYLEMHAAIKNPSDLYWEILHKLTGKSAYIEQKSLSSHQFKQELYAFLKSRQREGDFHQILLILDEYPYLLPGRSGGHGISDYLEVLGVFKTLAEEGWFNFLPCGRTAALSRVDGWKEGENPFFGILHGQFLEPLARAEVEELVTVLGSKAEITFADEAIERIWTMAGGHPLFTRTLGSQIRKEYPRVSRVTAETVDGAVDAVLRGGEDRDLLRKIYQKELEEDEQEIVEKLAISSRPLSRAEFWPDNATRQDRWRVDNALTSLVETSVITRDEQKRYSHRYELLRLVILQDLEG